MTDAKIFLVGGKVGERLVPMVETAYPNEGDIQSLLEQYWDLLPGDQIDPENPRRWLLISREMGVPADHNEGVHWSLDHLFLDQDGIPTFVECKLAANPEVRRKVVAQMLDYAANGIEYWEMEKLLEAATRTAKKQDGTLEQAVLKLIEKDDPDAIESYWRDVEANLRSGKVRLIFVTEHAPRELRRLIEFLNEKMTDVRLFIVEIRQFICEGHTAGEVQRALVPRAIGAISPKSPPSTLLSREEFLSKCRPEAREFFGSMLDKSEARKHSISWGQRSFTVRAHLPNGGLGSFAYGWLSGEFQFFTGQVGIPLSEEQSKKLREDLLRFGVFTSTAPKTLTAQVDRETAPRLSDVYDFILDKVDDILRGPSESKPS